MRCSDKIIAEMETSFTHPLDFTAKYYESENINSFTKLLAQRLKYNTVRKYKRRSITGLFPNLKKTSRDQHTRLVGPSKIRPVAQWNIANAESHEHTD